jgi:SAM-dependent methyltransferase
MLAPMDERLQREAERLAASWMQYDSEMLGTYLVAGVEDPRINVQSVLTRHFLIVALLGDQCPGLMEQELRFALVANWVLSVLQQSAGPEDLEAIRHALGRGADNAEGLPIPRFVAATHARLPTRADGIEIPNYIAQMLDPAAADSTGGGPTGETLATFQRAWHERLAAETPRGLSVLEPACGSANDYRFLEAFGLARLIDYAGFDLCEKNAANACRMFPEARFFVGNAFAVPVLDGAFDCCIVHDLFEHLSVEAMEVALAEGCRVTKRSLCLGFFNLHEGDQHLVRPVDDYHWNSLSLPKIRSQLERHGFQARIVHIDTFLRWRFACDQTHNKNAYTIFADRRSAS